MKKVTPFCNTWDILGLFLHWVLGNGNGISQWRSVENFLRKTN